MKLIAWLVANKLRALCGVLIVAALAVTLFNTSEFASWYEPTPALAWAWACYVDMAIIGYTLAQAHGKGDRTVRFAFWWFIGLSLIANVAVTLARYDALRTGGGVVQAIAASWWFMVATCALYGASIPISVYTFAHTLADGRVQSGNAQAVLDFYVGDAPAPAEKRPRQDSARERVAAAWREMGAGARPSAIAKRAGVSVTTARKWKGGI